MSVAGTTTVLPRCRKALASASAAGPCGGAPGEAMARAVFAMGASSCKYRVMPLFHLRRK